MHGNGTPVVLAGYGGLVTLASPDNLPEGASPRTYDGDYNVGSWETRAGLKSVYSYSGSGVGPNSGGLATDIPISGNPWANPSNILANDGNVTTVTLSGTRSGNATLGAGSNSGSGAVWNSPINITDPSAVTTADLTGSGTTSVQAIPPSANVVATAFFSGAQFLQVQTFAFAPGTASQISVTLDGVFTSTNGASFIEVDLSTDNGATYTNIFSSGTDFGYMMVVASSGPYDLSTAIIKVTCAADIDPVTTPPSTTQANVLEVAALIASGSSLNTQTLTVPVSWSGPPPSSVSLSLEGFYTGAAATIVVNGASISLTSSNATYTMSLGGVPSSVVITGSATGTSVISLNNLAISLIYEVTGTDPLQVTQFAFSLPGTIGTTGAQFNLTGFANSPTDVTLQLMKAGTPVGVPKTQALPALSGVLVFGSPSDTWGTTLSSADVNNTGFGVQITVSSAFLLATASLDYVSAQLGTTTGLTNFDFITTFTAQDGTVKNISLDADGDLWIENVTTNQGVLTLVREGITPNSFCVGVNGPDVEYLAFSDGLKGSDIPLQYTAGWIDRITQVGPGAAPTFTPISASANTYTISTITQPAARSRTSSYFLQSQGPGSTTAGNVVTVYYSDSTLAGPDTDLTTAFNSGLAPVNIFFSFTGSGITTQGPYTVQVTSVGEGQPPGQPRAFYYFTFNLPTVAFTYFQGSGHPTYTANYQRSEATMTMTSPVPGLEIGDQITITGASVTDYDSEWTITQTPNSGQYVITSSQVSGGLATFGYADSGGVVVPPVAGQLVTITGTTNAGGQLNFTNAVIVTGGSGATGTFTVNVSVPDAGATAESGLATTAGTIFIFDPGTAVLSTPTSPIFGSSTGGSFTFSANAQFIANGTRQGTVFFITRNGYYTYPAVPVTFTTPENTTGISISNIPIGPPNVIARGIAITEAGQNGVPGANFFTLPTQVQVIVNNVLQTSTSLFILDNISTSTTVAFSDSVLLNGLNIGTYGYNLFNQIEIGDPGWISSYDSRNVYGLCWNKVQNFNNLSFDGGYLPNTRLVPLGWTINDAFGALTVSAKFGNSWYVQNTTGGTVVSAGSISQSAYQSQDTSPPGTTDGTPIINANTAYSVRVTARIPSGNTTGSIAISISNLGVALGEFVLPFAQMTSNFAIYTGPLLTTVLPVVPPGLTLNFDAINIGVGADVEIDRIEVYPTAIPVLTTTEYWSYAGLYEQVDAVTGKVVYESENQQPVNGAVVMYDTHYALKGWSGTAPGASLYSLQSSANLEPAQWQEPEVAQKSGAIGVYAYDFGEQWIVMANRAGLFLFEGGQPGKINHEIIQIWDAINWTAGKCIWVRNIVSQRKLLVGVPLPTPNFWLPNAPVNTNPTTPNVMIMLNYQGLDSGEQIKSEPQMHTTMFGTLTSIDMRRKWSLWQIPSPYAAICQGATDEELYICNGRGNSKVYQLDDTVDTDDGVIIDSLYTTAGLSTLQKRAEMPALGTFRMRWGYMVVSLESLGLVNVTLYPNKLLGPGAVPAGYTLWQLPGGFTPGSPALNDVEASLNFAATRTFFEFRQNDGNRFSLSNFVATAKADIWNKLRGAK